MLNNRKPLVVFRIAYNRKGQWGAVSNFITKFTEQAPVDESDVQDVSTCVFSFEYTHANILARNIVKHSQDFKEVNHPENLYQKLDDYEYVFCITVDYGLLNDVVDLQGLYMILDICKSYRIISIVEGEAGDFYKISHYFSFVSSLDEIYNAVFYREKANIFLKRLQRRNIGRLTRFLPLLPIDCDTEMILKTVVGECNDWQRVRDVLDNAEGAFLPSEHILAGACRKLQDNRKKFAHCAWDQCLELFSKENIITFLLFAFSIDGLKQDFKDLEEIRTVLQKDMQWANGCLQLIENIIFHSQNHRGAFSFRILKSGQYIADKYGIKSNTKWIEIMISDYPGTVRTRNIAEVFCHNLENIEQKDAFAQLKPVDFFAEQVNESVTHAWNGYYAQMSNLINHYGIRIFREIIERSKGHFIAQSHSMHYMQQGEAYGMIQGDSGCDTFCLPGTSYSIMFPLQFVKTETREEKQTEIDYGIEAYDENIPYVKMCSYPIQRLDINVDINPQTVQEKSDNICQIVDQIVKYENNSILHFDAGKIHSSKNEILYKSIVKSIIQDGLTRYFVLYNCSDELVNMFLAQTYHNCKNIRDNFQLQGSRTQAILYTASQCEEIIVIPADWHSTVSVNNRNNFVRETKWKDKFAQWGRECKYKDQKIVPRIMADVFIELEPGKVIFEKYVENVVNTNMQGQGLGCKLENIHMRLGSTIHVNHFYEAEILFGNSLFIERFSIMIVNKLREESLVTSESRITLYGYSDYSEQLIYRVMQILQETYQSIDVDYAILEREAETRGVSHFDSIRYSRVMYSGNEKYDDQKRKEYFKDRKIICIIPIASTLKTNEKLINLFCEKNGEHCKKNFIKNYELILVSSLEENKYWTKEGKKIKGKEQMEIEPEPEYFAEVMLKYEEPQECEQCFPEVLVDEIPLVEVNASSTIPNQAFGIRRTEIGNELEKITSEKIERAEEQISIFENILLYHHLIRGENHFMFYIQTNYLMINFHDRIEIWLRGIKNQISISANDLVVLFSPSHFSNAGFVESVNSIIFNRAAMVIRDDVDKEYRCNFSTKYSNLAAFIEKLKRADDERKIRFFYVDDSVNTGRTLARAKSLVQSLISEHTFSERQKYVVFDGVFVLVDRNSRFSRWQYVGSENVEEHFFAFRSLSISSLRTHGDSCVLCNLRNEAENLKKKAVLEETRKYWEREEEKFDPKLVGEYEGQNDRLVGQQYDNQESILVQGQKKKQRAYRRLLCTNNAMIFLSEKYHGNIKEETLRQMLVLILEGSSLHKGEEKEYFLSYCKVISRPFRVFDKSVKEAIFDFLLIVMESVVFERSMSDIIKGSKKKQYLSREDIKNGFDDVEDFIQKYFTDWKDKKDLVYVLLKQLTELKSNFIIRTEVINAVLKYAKDLEKREEDLLQYYRQCVKKLLGVSSDTSKSVRVDKILYTKHENNAKMELDIPNEVRHKLYLENVRVFQDAYDKLIQKCVLTEEDRRCFFHEKSSSIQPGMLLELGKRIEGRISRYQFKDYMDIMGYYGFMDNNKLTASGCIMVAANLLLYKYILEEFGEKQNEGEEEEERILDKCNHIAIYMNYIFAAEQTIIMMENAAEYDEWEDVIIDRYNTLVKKLQEQKNDAQNSCTDLTEIRLRRKKNYIVLGSSKISHIGEAGKVIEDRCLLDRMKTIQMPEEDNYIYDLTDKFFAWKLGERTGHIVYVYCEWTQQLDDLGTLNRVRNVMQYAWQLNEKVFNRSNTGFFHELVTTSKKLLEHSRYKAHTHTKNDIKLKQYEHAIKEKRYEGFYRSDILTLLADLNVSEHYRNSLTRDYYFKNLTVEEITWGDFTSIFKANKTFHVIDSDTEYPVQAEVCYGDEDKKVIFFEIGDTPLTDADRIVSFNYTNAGREMFLLVYSLIINAATNNRGLVENNRVKVYLSRTRDRMLRITNAIGGNDVKRIEDINQELTIPPDGETGGISLWSMSRYIKRVLASLLDESLKIAESCTDAELREKLLSINEQINCLMGIDFEVSVSRDKIGDKEYFSVLLPLLADKYENYFRKRRNKYEEDCGD